MMVEFGVDHEQERRRACEHNDRRGELDDAGAGEGPDLLDVAGQVRDELAGLDPVVVAEAEALDLGEEVVSEVVGDPLRRALREVLLRERE